jgi:hypothetical protein
MFRRQETIRARELSQFSTATISTGPICRKQYTLYRSRSILQQNFYISGRKKDTMKVVGLSQYFDYTGNSYSGRLQVTKQAFGLSQYPAMTVIQAGFGKHCRWLGSHSISAKQYSGRLQETRHASWALTVFLL